MNSAVKSTPASAPAVSVPSMRKSGRPVAVAYGDDADGSRSPSESPVCAIGPTSGRAIFTTTWLKPQMAQSARVSPAASRSRGRAFLTMELAWTPQGVGSSRKFKTLLDGFVSLGRSSGAAPHATAQGSKRWLMAASESPRGWRNSRPPSNLPSPRATPRAWSQWLPASGPSGDRGLTVTTRRRGRRAVLGTRRPDRPLRGLSLWRKPRTALAIVQRGDWTPPSRRGFRGRRDTGSDRPASSPCAVRSGVAAS